MNGVPWHRISFGWSSLAKRKLGSPWFSNGAVMKLPVVWVILCGMKATSSRMMIISCSGSKINHQMSYPSKKRLETKKVLQRRQFGGKSRLVNFVGVIPNYWTRSSDGKVRP